MFRLSNHWGKLANSKWRLISLETQTKSKYKLGFAEWEHFYPDNDSEKIYFLEYNSVDKTINYNHYKNLKSDNQPILRTTFDTRKRIKQARNILNLSNWSKYYKVDIDVLRNKIIHELIYTEKSLDEIKQVLHIETLTNK